jgi:acyl transferase domain-containing protein
VVSTLTGQVARRGDFSVDYWVRHIAEPVNFVGAMRALDQRGKHLFVELGPASTLTPLGKRCVPPGRHLWLTSVRPTEQDGEAALDALARAYAAGQPIAWPAFHRGVRRRRVELPAYAFERESYRLPTAATVPTRPVADPAVVEDPVVADTAAVADTAVLAEGGERLAAITMLIRQKVAAVLEFSTLAGIEADVEFTELGMDSLLAIKLRKELGAALGITFATPEIFNHPTPLALAGFLDGHLDGCTDADPVKGDER